MIIILLLLLIARISLFFFSFIRNLSILRLFLVVVLIIDIEIISYMVYNPIFGVDMYIRSLKFCLFGDKDDRGVCFYAKKLMLSLSFIEKKKFTESLLIKILC